MHFLWFVARTLASVKISKLKGAIWSADMSHVALYSKHGRLTAVYARRVVKELGTLLSLFYEDSSTLCIA